MDALKLRALENILYRQDTVEERTHLLWEWIKREEIDEIGFESLVQQCNDESVERDNNRKYGKKI